jgi:ankyrin repeat protein
VALRRKLAALSDVNAPLKGDGFKSPLQLVAARGFISEAAMLLSRGAAIDAGIEDLFQQTPLEEACAHGRIGMVEFLLSRGAQLERETILRDPAIIFRPNDKRDAGNLYRFCRALYCAVRSGNIETVKLLTRHGADVRHVNDNKETFLHIAAENGSVEMISYLAGEEIDLEHKKNWGLTALHWGAMHGNKEAVKQLLSLGADPNAEDDEGSTPFDLAPANRPDIAALLRGSQMSARKKH